MSNILLSSEETLWAMNCWPAYSAVHLTQCCLCLSTHQMCRCIAFYTFYHIQHLSTVKAETNGFLLLAYLTHVWPVGIANAILAVEQTKVLPLYFVEIIRENT